MGDEASAAAAAGSTTQVAGGATGTPPAAAPATGGTPVAAPANAPWYSGFSDTDLKGYVEVKGFKDPQTMAESYRNLEKLRGVPQERLLTLPEKLDDDKAMADVYKRLGRPEKASEYDVKLPPGVSDDFANWARDNFHNLGLSKKQGETLASKWNERIVADAKSHEDKIVADSNVQHEKLKQEWGAAFEHNINEVRALAKATGLTAETYQSLEATMGVDGFAKFMHGLVTKFGIKLGDHAFQTGEFNQNSFGPLSPAAAKAKLDMLMSDKEWVAKYTANSAKEKQEMETLQRYMLAGE